MLEVARVRGGVEPAARKSAAVKRRRAGRGGCFGGGAMLGAENLGV